MQISSRFTIATHMLTLIVLECQERKVTSDVLAASIGVNPVIIRKILSQLKSADLISVARGRGGASIRKDLKDMTLLDVYQVVESLGKSGKLFNFHEHPNSDCPIGRNIHFVLDDKLAEIQTVMEEELNKTSLADVVASAQEEIKKQSVS